MRSMLALALPSLAALAVLATPMAAQSVVPPAESPYYAVDYLTPPDGAVLEVGGLDFLSDGRLIVSTRRGQVWIVENPLAANPAEARFSLFAEGLEEGLGLTVLPAAKVDGRGEGDAIFVLQRGELSRLFDLDGDGRCDRIETVSNSWGLSGHYHEFAFGLPADDAGQLYITLNVSFGSPRWWIGESTVPYRGWCLRIDPFTGETTPVASGLRSPAGLGRTSDGRILITDNQGDWLPACPLHVLQPGAFYGHPASLRWTPEYLAAGAMPSDSLPPPSPRTPPALWLPYKWSRSAGSVVEDASGGRFGPFAGQLLIAELTNGMLLRAQLEQVQGQWQGAVWPFRQRIGSLVRVRFAPDGTLLGGMTNRGWGGVPPADGLCRIRWTGKVPLETQEVKLLQDGFQLRFTQPLAADCTPTTASCTLTQYDYDWWWEYGSPERHTTRVAVKDVSLSPDRRSLVLRAPLQPAMMARLQLSGLRGADGAPLLHDEFAYAIHQLPEGPRTELQIAKIVAPPPPRELGEEGWLRLSFLDALAQWDSQGWSLVDADLDPKDPTRLLITKGDSALVNVPHDVADAARSGPPGATATDFTSKALFGEGRYHAEVMLPEGGRTTLWLMGRYGIDLPDRRAIAESAAGPAGTRFGAVLATAKDAEHPPALDAWLGSGQWHDLDVMLTPPRFDADGRKIANARIERVLLNDVLLHEGLELAGPCLGAPLAGQPEAPTGPLIVSGTRGACALRQLRVRPVLPADDVGWVPLFNGQDLAGWRVATESSADPEPLRPGTTFTAPDEDAAESTGWSVENGLLVGRGPPSHLFSPRGDFHDLEIRASLRISHEGNSGLYFRTLFGPGWPDGYEAQVNSDSPDPQKTGSLYALAPVTTSLVGPGTWFDYRVRCVDEAAGTHITIAVNGVVITDFVDAERRHALGHVALQQHNDGSTVECRRLEVREVREAR
jgi:glucose/arabinose dehydrogenase